MSNTITRGVRVIVTPEYLPEQSLPDAGRWLFAYHVVLRNEGSETVQLLNRHWVITNGEGEVDEVRGAGHARRHHARRVRDASRLHWRDLRRAHRALPACGAGGAQLALRSGG